MSYLREKLPEAETSLRDTLFLAEPWRKVLWDAANIIVQRGWCQYVAEDHMGQVCMGGAIARAESRNVFNWNAGGVPVKRLIAVLPAGYACSISEWNNTRGRTSEEVIAKLREVALS